jgi:hypothetical protein
MFFEGAYKLNYFCKMNYKALLAVRLFILFLAPLSLFSQSTVRQVSIQSPNQKINVALFCQQNSDAGEWCLKASYNNNGTTIEAIPHIDLGLSRSDQDFSKELKFLKSSKPILINEQYAATHGKRSVCSNTANEVIVSLENPSKAKLNIIIRAYNDGIAFRYEFPEKQGSFVVKDELTSYTIPQETTRWMEKWNAANEGLYTAMSDDKIQKQE